MLWPLMWTRKNSSLVRIGRSNWGQNPVSGLTLMQKLSQTQSKQSKQPNNYCKKNKMTVLPSSVLLLHCSSVKYYFSDHSLQAVFVSVCNGSLDHSVPPFPHIKGLQTQEGQQHPQVLYTVLDRSTCRSGRVNTHKIFWNCVNIKFT